MNGLTLREARILRAGLAALHRDPYLAGSAESAANAEHVSSLETELDEFIDALSGDVLLELWTDGAARPTNPGPAGIGVVGKVQGRTVIEVAEHIGKTTNNVAEYLAAVTALRRAVDMEMKRVHLRSDSKLLVNQVLGEWKCKDDSLLPLLGRVKGLAQRFDEFTIEWIPRTKNREADGLSVAGAYTTRACGACGHPFHTSFCLVLKDTPPNALHATEACGCPTGFRKGLEL